MMNQKRIVEKLKEVYMQLPSEFRERENGTKMFIGFSKLPRNIFKRKSESQRSQLSIIADRQLRLEEKHAIKMIPHAETWEVRIFVPNWNNY